ncbi:MAG: FeoB-associated Cys-rich membrane protein [Ruminococcus sp.]|nr:FeoB-associated Cys-rich membrane protein [Ruminococcus sp.]
MLSWLGANIGTIIVCAVLVLIVTAIVMNMIKDKKKGKSVVCGGKCGHCPMNCGCGGCGKGK